MSNINLKRAIDNIRSSTTVYTPIVEIIVNSIQAIESNNDVDGKITVRLKRDEQHEMNGNLPEVRDIEIEDNGVGFNDENRHSFDTLYTDLKIAEGGKGFGRFTCMKYFENLHVDSIYCDGRDFKRRVFSMGKKNDIIVNESITPSTGTESGTVIRLSALKKGKSKDKKLSTIARNLVEKLLPYLITKDYKCPEITLTESDGSKSIRLNDYISNELTPGIKEIPVTDESFVLRGVKEEKQFIVRIFKFYSPKNQKSKISLVAHKREVSGSAIHNYIPEFIEEFYETDSVGNVDSERNYIIKAYVFSDYLDDHVSLERGDFEFHKENDILFGISQVEIESKVAHIAKEVLGEDITTRQNRKRDRVKSYVDDNAPWHKGILDEIDLSEMPYNPSDEQIETKLQKEKYKQEAQIKKDVNILLEESNPDNLKENVQKIVSNISGTSKNDLIHYIALRRNILDIFKKSLEFDSDGVYSSEGVVHDIIFPRKGDSDSTSLENHNLWIIDERLNFTNYVSSDIPLDGGRTGRPDLLVYDKRIVFRGDNEASNPVTIFEFKKPQRDDFVNPSSSEDPVQQIVRYVNSIRDGKYKTPEGRKILVADNTPFYGYVVCDLTSKVERWLEREKNFKPMPDRLGWFQWYENINLYIEIASWDKIIKDANMRNRVFFHKLGIA